MGIVRNETTEHLANIGDVAFESFQNMRGTYWHETYGRTHQQAFRFVARGREYWGQITRTFDKSAPSGERTSYNVELRTRSKDGFGRDVGYNCKLLWKADLRAAFRDHLEQYLSEQGA